jgi:hypothetical protein
MSEEWMCGECSGFWEDQDWAGYPHGATCIICNTEVFEPWCEAVAGNDGNGFCSDCISIGNMSLEDQYEDQ